MNIPEMSLAFLEILKAGGFTTGGLNFDAKIRRQSIDPDDLLHAHVGSMDACARGLLIAAKIIEDGKLGKIVAERYAKWDEPKNKAMLDGKETLESIADARACRGPRAAAEIRPAGASREPAQHIYLRTSGRTTMATDIKGPAIFLAQFAGDAAPFNSWDSITKWAASLGYKGVQIPTWDGRLFDLKKAADIQDLLRRGEGRRQGQWRGDHRALDPSAGPARGGAPGL